MRAKVLNLSLVSQIWVMTAIHLGAFAQTSPDKTPLPQGNASSLSATNTGSANKTDLKTAAENSQNKQTNPSKLENHPSWQDLSEDQRIALAPLQKLWAKMSDFQKQKWLVISKNYMLMGQDEQSRLQSRMNDWVSLSNQERAVARLNFAEVNKLSEDQKRVKWEAYQALEPDAKQKLLDAAQPLPKGAAIAAKPTNKALLTITPGLASMQSASHLPRIDVSQISTHTLLALPKSISSDKSAGQIKK